MFSNKISSIGLAAILICTVAPLMRLTYNGIGILMVAFFLATILTLINIKKISFIKPQNQVLLILLWSLCSSLMYYGFQLDSLKILLASILLFLYLPNKQELNIILILQVFVAIFFIYGYFYLADTVGGGVRKYIILQELNFDPNVVAGSLFIPAVLGVKFILDNNNIYIKLLSLVFIILLILSILMSGTRGGLIAVLISVLSYLLVNKSMSKKQICFLVIFLFIGLMFMYSRSNDFLSDDVMERYTMQNINESGGSGRVGLATLTLNYLNINASTLDFLFGLGFGSAVEILGMGTHNTLLDYFWGTGIIGLIVFIIIMIHILKYCIQSKVPLSIACILGSLTWSLSISASNVLLFWINIYIAISLARLGNKKQLLQ